MVVMMDTVSLVVWMVVWMVSSPVVWSVYISELLKAVLLEFYLAKMKAALRASALADAMAVSSVFEMVELKALKTVAWRAGWLAFVVVEVTVVSRVSFEAVKLEFASAVSMV